MKRLTGWLVLASLSIGDLALPALLQSGETVMAEMPPQEFSADAKHVKALSTGTIDAWTHESKLCLVIRSLPTDNKLRIPRLANSLKSVYWWVVPGEKMNLQPEPSEWIIDLKPLPADAPALLILELDSPLTLFSEGLTDQPNADGVVVLPASHAKTKGVNLRFEPQAHKNTVGYWSVAEDTAEWKFAGAKAGEYEVDILQGCGAGHGGSQVQLMVGDEKLEFTVKETGHFQNFIWRTIGTVNVSTSESEVVKLIPVRKAGGAVMDVRQIRLVPKGSQRSFESQLADPAALPKE